MCCDVDLKWLPFYKQALISKFIIAYKRLRGEVISYLNDLLKLNSNVHIRLTRYSNVISISPKCDRQTEGGRTFTSTRVEQLTSVFNKTKNLLNVFKYTMWNERFSQQQSPNHFII